MMEEKKTKNFLFGCLIAVSLFVIFIVILANIKVTPLKTYQDKQFKFSLKYPEYWVMEERPHDGLGLVQFSAPQSSEFDKIYESVNITLVDLALKPQLQNIDNFTKTTTTQLLGVFGDYVNVVESKKIRLGGLPAYRLTYVTLTETAFAKAKFKYLHAWTVRGRHAFILTFVGEKDGFNANLRHVNRMIRTFKFEK